MTSQELLEKELMEAIFEATRYGITEGTTILTSPFSKESNEELHDLLMEKVPLMKKPDSDEPMTEFTVSFNDKQSVYITLVNNILTLITFGGIRPIDGIPERYPPEPTA